MRMLIAVSKLVAANSKLAAAIVASAMLVSFGPNASALPYSTSGAAELFSLGDQLGAASQFDTLQVLGAQGTIDPNASTSTIRLNTLIFTAGFNALVPAKYTYSFNETVTIGTGTGTLVVPFNLSIDFSDTLTIVQGTKLSILVGANLWNLVVNGLTMGPNPGGPSEVAYLTAQVSDPPASTPLPAALVLFGSGLGAMGLFGRRRKLKASAVPVA